MAKTPTTSADAQGEAFVREVDEAYRADQVATLWDRYGRTLLILIGVGLIAVAGYLYWQEQQVVNRSTQAEQFDASVKGLELGDTQSRDEMEALAESDVAGYSDLARLTAAGFKLDDGDVDGAAAAYRAIAEDNDVEMPLRDLARVRAARLTFDTTPPEQIVSELATLAQPESAWFGVAGEMAAAAYVKSGDTQRAANIYQQIAASEDLPPSLRNRAGQLALAYGASPESLTPGAAGAEAETSASGAPANASQTPESETNE